MFFILCTLYLYYQHKFSSKGKLLAVGLVKEAVVKAGAVIVPQTLLDDDLTLLQQHNPAGYKAIQAKHQSNQQLHPVVEQWLKTQLAVKQSS